VLLPVLLNGAKGHACLEWPFCPHHATNINNECARRETIYLLPEWGAAVLRPYWVAETGTGVPCPYRTELAH
jgi:hypothetical protein